MKHILVILLFLLGTSRLSADYYVSPSGSDSNPGSLASPFATINMARKAIESLVAVSGLPSGGINVWLRAGYYNQSSTFELTSIDAGTASAPIVYSAYQAEQVYITGSVSLNPSGFTPLNSSSPVWSRLSPASQGNVYSINLPAQGVTNYGSLKAGGFGLSVIAPLELFCNGQPMTLGRWPNANQPLAQTVTAPSNAQFTYSGSEPSRWTQAQDIWMHGLWNTTWADFQLDVASIDSASNTVTFSSAPQYNIGPNQSYYAYNLLEEIDEPGEYYVDRIDGILYFWPPAPLSSSTLQVSMLETPLLQLDNTSFITFRNITFEATRGPLLRINGGNNNCAVGCLFRNCGQYATYVTGSSNGLNQCEIADSGEDGVILGGGTRSTLTAGNNYVTNCRIHRVGRISWTYHPAINLLNGSGNLAANNLIDELPHSAILLSGNNHVIELNEISRVCQLTSDAGAIYSDRDWGYRGNLISGNFIHHIQNSPAGKNTHGVYLDDLMSGAEVTGNVFYEISGGAIVCGGGRDNIMTNNIIGQCGIGHFNGDYARSYVDDTPGDSWNLLERLADDEIQYQSNPWATEYPACAAIPNSFAAIEGGLWRNPQGCIFSNNAGWSNVSWMTEVDTSGTGIFEVYAAIANNNPSQPALFDEATSWDRTLRPAELTAAVSGFAPISFASIGPSMANPSAVVLEPPVPVLQILSLTSSEADFQWTDDGIHSEQQETGFEVQEQNAPGGSWQVILTFGPDVDYAAVSGLETATTYYSFRVRSFNAVGSVYSNVVTVGPPPAPSSSPITSAMPGASDVTVTEASNPLSVLADFKVHGTVGVSWDLLNHFEVVRLPDIGDTILVSFVSGAGNYTVAALVRSGDGSGPTSFWTNSAYAFSLDGNLITLVGNPLTVSPRDSSSFGPVYWGTMSSSPVALLAGTHSFVVRAVQNWAMIVNVQTTPSSSSQ